MNRHVVSACKSALSLALAGFLVLSAGVARADFAAGVAAAQAEDYETAMKEWLPLAEQGVAGAQSNIGDMFSNGLGMERDDTQAFFWHIKAAEQGVVKSIFFVGAALAAGQGVEKDLVEGTKWLLLAQRVGFPNATQVLSLVSQSMSPEDAAESERRADEWTPTTAK
ncbi:MAG: sel1 repeat family protein [Alphaproteobacteria bacterium]|nr:sel1 repeat family protein [Alphaproteobacteria bacterium]